MSETCTPHHDYAANALTALLCVGLVISYLPQHLRIIKAGSSEGFSPWFLLLGSTSSASGMLNIVVMQWDIIKCCRVLSVGNCAESIAGVFQLSLQWFLFTVILVLYMVYYPLHLQYSEIDVDLHDSRGPQRIKTSVKSDAWRLSITLSWVVFIHIAFITFVTFLLLSLPSSPDSDRRSAQISIWATFLGIASALLAALQYAPQIMHTYRMKLVGALSIPMMLIQSPGAVFMVLSIALRPGTNWTTWLPYAVAGAMQGSLLIMCLFWLARQRRLGIDDFGNPLSPPETDEDVDSPVSIIINGPEEGVPVRTAVEAAVESDVRRETEREGSRVNERSPLLDKGNRDSKQGWKGWLGWLKQ
ncbi:hypothetical protein WOLCODRAFT_110170 [Wolfiporia cocos MD-104 SS10]|uniref:PQ-loop-domain-containing protein n=1 Tax=Wolfiporia cocos (strain MD-104) TaxID=742152 RepID=A0A2H3JIM9_WOLCO|nr:hypothetical protein WOLCODRAFT_110170 [Wolfiporia cocos MD-104 SS10]